MAAVGIIEQNSTERIEQSKPSFLLSTVFPPALVREYNRSLWEGGNPMIQKLELLCAVSQENIARCISFDWPPSRVWFTNLTAKRLLNNLKRSSQWSLYFHPKTAKLGIINRAPHQSTAQLTSFAWSHMPLGSKSESHIVQRNVYSLCTHVFWS